MQLEDHLGDIVRKARSMSKVSHEAAARAAGASVETLSQLEDSGAAQGKIDFAALAELIGLDARKLQSIVNGWTPVEKDLSNWREFRVITTTAHGMGVNAYLVWDEASREAAVFDTGWTADPIIAMIRTEGLQLKHLFITHSHEDHIADLELLRREFPKARLHTSNKAYPVENRNRQNEFVQVGSLRITHRDTPGHAEDGTTYIIGGWPEDAPHVAIVGDAIFAGSMGKGNQSWVTARQKVREEILSLPPETLICPGHGPLTTVAEEKEHNPFF